MKCPHCQIEINENFNFEAITTDVDGNWGVFSMICPNKGCRKLILKLVCGEFLKNNIGNATGMKRTDISILAYPQNSSRPPAPVEVDKMFSDDYHEACQILSLSPKASAALSRRCLQNILREKAGVKHGNLVKEIEEVIKSNSLPSYLSESIDAIRHIGNFAAHPTKSTSTGEIIEVEPGEAEWLLDVIESLFDFYFVQPAILQTKKVALNAKLSLAGKLPMK
jgi:hypothetical protein